jgi:hypothetical protein
MSPIIAYFIVCIGTAFPTTATAAPKPNLQRLEAGKWHPSTLGGAAGMQALFAPDFVSVEYGANPAGPASRRGQYTIDPKLAAMLDSTRFEISDMTALSPSASVTILSYRVTAPAMGWSAWATSTWAKRNGRWQTIFYQASRVTP